jgi:hypothetical protein
MGDFNMPACFRCNRRLALAALCVAVSLSACADNQYGPPPPDGKPRNAGQQHYLDMQRYQETIDHSQSE